MEKEDFPVIKNTCEHCKQKEGTLRADPYSEQVYEKIVMDFICDECYSESIWAI